MNSFLIAGQTITTAKSELKEILVKLNIQVGNPICILNQNLVREFLIGSDASKLYQLFLKANKLDDIKQKFDDSVISVDHMETLLKESNEVNIYFDLIFFRWHAKNSVIQKAYRIF